MPSSPCLRVLWYLVWLVVTKDVRGSDDRLDGLVGGSVDQVDVIVSQVAEQHLTECHLVLATTENHTTLFSSMLRQLAAKRQAIVVVRVGSLFSQDEKTRDYLLQRLWGDARKTCHALILHTGNNTNNNFLFSFLEVSGVWMRPETPVVVISDKAVVETVVDHTSLRNTLHVLCFALDVSHLESPENTRLKNFFFQKGSERVKAMRRCLYCNDGKMDVQVLQQSILSSSVQRNNILFPEKLRNFNGHTFKVVTLEYFPFIAYDKNSSDPDGPVSPRDSLDFRMLNTIAALLNFTYEIREPWDGTWGVPSAGGNWSGIVGTLQHHKADFSVNLTPSSSRMKAMTHSRIYSHDPMIIVSLKPGPLPRRLALMRPFAGELWLSIIVCTFVAGAFLWLLQKGWSWASGGRSLSLDSSLFFSWGVLLEDQPFVPPANISGQMLVGWWLLSCLIIGTAYRSSLIAHLTVQSKYPPINNFEDILKRDGLSWGSTYLWGTLFIYYNQSSDPVVQDIYRQMQTYELMDGIKRVLEGGFAFIVSSLYTKTAIASLYSNRYDSMPLYLSTTEYSIFGGNSWGFRQGAPCVGPIRRMKQRLIEAGLIDLWLDEVIQNDGRNKRAKSGSTIETVHSEVSDKQVVLGLDHLQGVFYLLLLGYVLGLCTVLGENVFSFFM